VGLELACLVFMAKLLCVWVWEWLIVVKAGQDLGVISDFLLPVIGVAVIITSFITPYLIKFAFKPEAPKLNLDILV